VADETWDMEKLTDGREIYVANPKFYEDKEKGVENQGYTWKDMDNHTCNLEKYVCCMDESMNDDDRLKDKDCSDCGNRLHATETTEVHICPQYWYRPNADAWGRHHCTHAHLCKGCIEKQKKKKEEKRKKKNNKKTGSKKKRKRKDGEKSNVGKKKNRK